MESRFSSHTLAETFRDLYLGESSGVLHLIHGELEKKIYFDRGLIVYAESKLPDEELGTRLVHEGKISSGALAEANRNISEAKDLPQALVNRGLIGKAALAHTVQFLINKIVQSVFQWEGGKARFNEGWLLQEIFDGDVVTTFEVILRGVAKMADFDSIKETLKGLDNRLGLRTPAPVPVEKLTLSPTQGFLLSRVDGSTTIADVLSILPPHEEDLAARFIYAMLVMGVVETDPKTSDGPFVISALMRSHADSQAVGQDQQRLIVDTYEKIRDQGPFDVLGVSHDAARKEIDRAYELAKRPFAKDVILPRMRERFRAELAVIEGKLVEAYLTASKFVANRSERAEPDDAEGTFSADDLLVRVDLDKSRSKKKQEEAKGIAEAYYAKARKFLREADFHNAIQYGKLAISYNPDEARFYILLAECQVKNPEARWQRMAEKNYLRATELDPWNVDCWAQLGHFYKRRGLKLRARKQFEEVLKLSPGNEDAVRELKELR